MNLILGEEASFESLYLYGNRLCVRWDDTKRNI